MANRTVKEANSIHGTNPQYIIEKIIRTRIYDSKYWKESCFALTAELLVDKAMELRYAGGVFGGNTSPTPFLCLILKMLQIQPEKDIVIEFIKQDEFKYVRLLGAFYFRLVYTSLDIYKYLEPLINDYRKIRVMNNQGGYFLSRVDEIIDSLMRDERVFDVILPRIQKRWVHENNNELEPRVSLLEDDLDDIELEEDSEEEGAASPVPSPRHRNDFQDSGHHRSRHSPSRRHDRSDRNNRDRHRRPRSRSREKRSDLDRDRRRRSRSKEKRNSDRHHRHRDSRDSRQYDQRDRDHKRREDRREDRSHHKDKKRSHKREKYDEEDPDIAEANALRAQLGMAPLRM